MVMTVLPSSQIETIRRNNSDQQVLLFVDLQANCLCITTAAYDYLKKKRIGNQKTPSHTQLKILQCMLI